MVTSEQVIELFNAGMSQKEIAARLDCSLNTVRRRMKLVGVEGRSKGERDYTINSGILDSIDTEQKAYWLGFILADGCIAKSAGTRRVMRVCLQIRDFPHLKTLARFFGYEGKFFDEQRNHHHRKSIVFNDVKLCKTLMDYGWWEYKTGQDFRILDVVPDNLWHHFVRGYFDGDGSIVSKRKKRKDGRLRRTRAWYTNITCKYELALDRMIERIVKLGGPYTIPRKRSKAYDLRWCNRARTGAIMEWLYKDASILLERKKTRYAEFLGHRSYVWRSIHDFDFNMNTNQLLQRHDKDLILDDFVKLVISEGWRYPKYSIDEDLKSILNINLNKYLIDNSIKPGLSPGNKIIAHFQPSVWSVKLNKRPCLTDIQKYPKMVHRAARALLMTPDKNIYPARFIRELKFAGLTSASILSVPAIQSAVKFFGLTGKWLDPCAGWGNRLLAAHSLGIAYEATDPGTSYKGLLKLKEWLGSAAIIHNLKWQDLKWPDADFILTSPPFHDKEDYLDNTHYDTFDKWYASFLKPLVGKSLTTCRTVFHVDLPMKAAIEKDFQTKSLPLLPGGRKQVSKEWFIEILR